MYCMIFQINEYCVRRFCFIFISDIFQHLPPRLALLSKANLSLDYAYLFDVYKYSMSCQKN